MIGTVFSNVTEVILDQKSFWRWIYESLRTAAFLQQQQTALSVPV
jgi:hypothetical protein